MLYIVGWSVIDGVHAQIAQNTWGTDWGLDGYIYLAFDPAANSGLGVCGIYSTVYTPLA